MPVVYKFICEKCGYEEEIFLGSGGFWYTKSYPQIVSAAIDGEFGTEIQKIFKAHPNAAVSYSKVLVECNNCGKHENIIDLSVYLPKNEGFDNERKLINFLNLDKCYNRVAKFEPKCKTCGGDVKIFDEDNLDLEDVTLSCPNCQSLMTGDWVGVWD